MQTKPSNFRRPGKISHSSIISNCYIPVNMKIFRNLGYTVIGPYFKCRFHIIGFHKYIWIFNSISKFPICLRSNIFKIAFEIYSPHSFEIYSPHSLIYLRIFLHSVSPRQRLLRPSGRSATKNWAEQQQQQEEEQ